MKRTAAAAAFTIAGTIMSGAANADSLQLAMDLGNVIGAEQSCGFAFKQEAITAFIEKRVKDDDMGFTANLNLFVGGTERDMQDMTESQKTAHCSQVKRVAKKFGFLD